MPIELEIAKTDSFKVNVAINYAEKAVELKLIGVLEEDQPLNQLADYLLGLRGEVESVSFDTRGITRINSSGVRNWMIFFRRVQGFPYKYSFSYLNEIFLDQANPYPNMLGSRHAPIGSFEAPYRCEPCQSRTLKVLRAKDFDPSLLKAIAAPVFRCESCGGTLRFDEVEKSYFSFLQGRTKA